MSADGEVYQTYEVGQKGNLFEYLVSITDRLKGLFQQDFSTYNNPFLLLKEKQLKLMTILQHPKLNSFRAQIEKDYQLNKQEDYYNAFHRAVAVQLKEAEAASQAPESKIPKVAFKLIQEFKELQQSQQIFGMIHNQQKSEIGNFLVIRNEQPQFELQNESTKTVINDNGLTTLSAIIVRQSYNTREREQDIKRLSNHIEKLLLFVIDDQGAVIAYLLERGQSRIINLDEVTVKNCRNAKHYWISK